MRLSLTNAFPREVQSPASSPPTPAATPPARVPSRDPRLDTAKGVLIVFVVLGHLLEAIDHWHTDAARVPLTLIYAFHMPAFVLLAGITAARSRPLRRVATLLLFLGTFQLVYFVEWRLIESGKAFAWTEPFWLLWFLLAMVWWQSLVPLMVRAPRMALVGSLAVSLGAGIVAWIDSPIGNALSLSRTLVLLPFFVLGVTCGTSLLDRLAGISHRGRLALLALAALALGLLMLADPGRGWLYASSGYAQLGVGPLEGVATRGTLLCVAALVTFAVLAQMPARDVGWLTTVGRRSLGIYLLHGLLVMALTPMLAGTLDEYGALAAWTLCVVTVSGIVTLLALPGPDRALRSGAAAVIERATPDAR